MQALAEESGRMPPLQSPPRRRLQESQLDTGRRDSFPDMRGSKDYQTDPSSPAVKGPAGAIQLWGMIKKSVQDKSFFETIKEELGHLPTVLQKSLTYGNHTRESSKMKRQNSRMWDQALPVKKASVYYGPDVTPSAWSAWDRSIGENHIRVKYVIFRNKRWGTTIELDEGSTGAIRYASNDHSKPLFVQQNGLQSPAAAFGAGRLVHDLKNKARPGSLSMNAQQEMYGEWIARVKGSKIVITQATSMHPSEKMHIILTPESFLFLGEVSSVTNQPMSFKVDVGKTFVSLDRKTVSEVKSRLDNAEDEIDSDDDISSGRGGLVNQPDALGCLRRALTSHTNKERLNHDAATEYLKLPVQVRMATIAETELKDLMMQQALGHISNEEFDKRTAAVLSKPLFPSSILTRDEALEASMFVDPENSQHIPAAAFHGFDKMSWRQKLKAAKEIQKKMKAGNSPLRNVQPVMLRQQSFQLVQKEEGAVEQEDPDDQPIPDKKRNTQYIELMDGIRSGGVKREVKATLARIQKEYDAFRGKEVRQLYEECMRCGRPGGVSGSGLCGLCIEMEKQKQEMGVTDRTTDPATYYGDSRALRGFDGFQEYVNVPLRKDQKFLNKRSDSFVSTPLDKHRKTLTDMGDLYISPMPAELPSHRSQEHAPENTDAEEGDAAPPALTMSAIEFLRLVRNNRLPEVRDTLLTNMNYAYERDEKGNTALLIAAQQGYKKLCQLLLHANSDVNAQNKHGNTVLHYCSQYGFHQLWNYFKKKGADDSLTNDHGLTCFEVEMPPK